MKIRVEHGDYAENEVVLCCRVLDDEMLEVLSLLRERTAKLAAHVGGETHMVAPGDIYYAESVDGKTFVYTAEQVLETAQTLMRLEMLYDEFGLMRVGKSQLVNLYQVAKLRSLPSSRIELTLTNGERLIASRRYAQHLKERLRTNE